MALTPEEQAELAALEAEVAEAAGTEDIDQEPESDILGTLGRAGLRTIDVLGAPVRSTISKGIEGVKAIGEGNIFPEGSPSEIAGKLGGSLKETFIDPITGVKAAPTFEEIRKGQLGIEDEDLSIPLPVDVPGIGESLDLAPTFDVLGGAATDPLTLSGVAPAKAALQGTGRKIAKSAFKDVDQEIAKRGAQPFSELAERAGVKGSATKVLDETPNIQKELGRQRDLAFKEADRVGAKTSLNNVFRDAEEAALKVADTDPKLSKRLLSEIKALRKQHSPTKDPKVLKRLPLSETTRLKTQFQNSLPENAFDVLPGGARVPKQGAQSVIDTLQRGLRKEVERAGNKALPGLGTEIADINRQFQTVKAAVGRSGKGPLAKQASKEQKKRGFSALDQLLAGSGIASAAFGNPAIGAGLALKKAGDIAGTSGGRQAIGGAFQKLANVPGLDTVLRRGVVESGQ